MRHRSDERPEEPRDHAGELAIEAPGAEEVSVLPWPLLLGDRLQRRMEESERYPWLVLATVLFGLFTVGFTITILAVSIPTIAEDLDSTSTTLTWVITGPLLAFGVVGPAAGRAADLWGQKRVFIIGLIGSAVFAVGVAAAWSAGSLIAFRVLSSAAGAAAGPASMALIHRVFPRERRVQAMGYWSLVMAGGPVLGVVAGGPVVEQIGWRWIFAIQAPLTMAGVGVAALLLPAGRRADVRGRFDALGAVLLATGATSLLLGLNRGPEWGWSSPGVLGALALSPMAFAMFVAWEGRTDHPLIRLDYLRRRNFAAPVATQFFTNFAYMGGFILTPLLLSDVFGYGPARIGLLSISRPLSFAIVAPIAGYLAVRVGERSAGVSGAIAVTLSMLALARVDAGSSDLVVVGSLALSGIGLGAASPSMAATIANAVDDEDLGVAGAAQQLITQVGVVAGIQLMQTVQVSREASAGLVPSYQHAYLLGAAVSAVGIVAAAYVRSGKRQKPARRATAAPEPAPSPVSTR